MKKAIFLFFLLSILTIGCSDESVYESQIIDDGEYVIKLYNTRGKLLLTKRGKAENLVTYNNYWEIRLLYPDIEAESPNTIDRFASLTMWGQTKINQTLELSFNKDYKAGLHQRWYSLDDDWGYISKNGTLKITDVDKLIIKGSFEILLEVDGSAQKNPNWGNLILAKGYFSSICPYESYGGCP